MKFENTGIENIVVDLHHLDDLMEEIGFVRAGQWDYERVTYDYKIEVLEAKEVYYLRVQGFTVEGDIGRHDATIKLLTPLLGKHYYPHGVEYGEGEVFPKSVLNKSDELLKRVNQALQTLS
ncbi:YugN family protein [Bacillus pinisoli]|uniref:YugN family protein n=1 Tax=Bacillus pinisoli TaxID=2901866 RepID=UPI001FF2295A|nr:YugN family protein [Bacillus pinisoli]